MKAVQDWLRGILLENVLNLMGPIDNHRFDSVNQLTVEDLDPGSNKMININIYFN